MDIFFSQNATVKLRPKKIPEEHADELANTCGNDLLFRWERSFRIMNIDKALRKNLIELTTSHGAHIGLSSQYTAET